jgi:saccharopine dehydrogenase-like NADP-dependent oxidoreductase
MSAIQITTAAGIATVVDLLAQGKLAARGFVRQEEIALSDFLGNRFGRVYDPNSMHAQQATTALETASLVH